MTPDRIQRRSVSNASYYLKFGSRRIRASIHDNNSRPQLNNSVRDDQRSPPPLWIGVYSKPVVGVNTGNVREIPELLAFVVEVTGGREQHPQSSIYGRSSSVVFGRECGATGQTNYLYVVDREGTLQGYPRTSGGIKLFLHNVNLRKRSLSLPLHFAKSAVREDTAGYHRTEANTLNPKPYLVSRVFLWAISVLGYVMVGYGWWNANRNFKIAMGWWLLFTVIGAVLLIYGVNALLDRPENVQQSTAELTFKIIHSEAFSFQQHSDSQTGETPLSRPALWRPAPASIPSGVRSCRV